MPRFVYCFTVDALLEAITAFHEDMNVLKVLNLPFVIVQLHRVDPMANGSVPEFTLWMGSLPIREKAAHSEVGLNGFTDSLVEGPLVSW